MEINPKELDKTLRACIDKSGTLLYLKLVRGEYWKTIGPQYAKNYIRAAYPGADASMFLASKIEYWHLAVGSDPGTPAKRTMKYGPVADNVADYLRIFVENSFVPSSKKYPRTAYSVKHEAEDMGCPRRISEGNEMIVALRNAGFECDDEGNFKARDKC
jgi:hypothetical protein